MRQQIKNKLLLFWHSPTVPFRHIHSIHDQSRKTICLLLHSPLSWGSVLQSDPVSSYQFQFSLFTSQCLWFLYIKQSNEINIPLAGIVFKGIYQGQQTLHNLEVAHSIKWLKIICKYQTVWQHRYNIEMYSYEQVLCYFGYFAPKCSVQLIGVFSHNFVFPLFRI